MTADDMARLYSTIVAGDAIRTSQRLSAAVAAGERGGGEGLAAAPQEGGQRGARGRLPHQGQQGCHVRIGDGPRPAPRGTRSGRPGPRGERRGVALGESDHDARVGAGEPREGVEEPGHGAVGDHAHGQATAQQAGDLTGLPLEAADLGADTGPADAGPSGGAGEVRFPGGGDQVLQPAQFHNRWF